MNDKQIKIDSNTFIVAHYMIGNVGEILDYFSLPHLNRNQYPYKYKNGDLEFVDKLMRVHEAKKIGFQGFELA